MLTVRRATEADVLSMAPRLRAADRRELEAIGRATPEECLMDGLDSPDPCYVAVDAEDTPHIIFGTRPSPDHFVGFVWMMGTDEIKSNWVQILRETKPWIDRIRGHYRILANAVHADNKVHIRWLKWAGFVFLRKIQINNQDFYEFAKLIPPEAR